MNDFISREAAQDSVQKHFDEGGFDGYTDGQLMMTRIRDIPSSDVVEVRHGHWIVSATNLHFDSKCSACEETFYSPLRGAYIVHHAKYCPNCGAKMDGGNKDEKIDEL